MLNTKWFSKRFITDNPFRSDVICKECGRNRCKECGQMIECPIDDCEKIAQALEKHNSKIEERFHFEVLPNGVRVIANGSAIFGFTMEKVDPTSDGYEKIPIEQILGQDLESGFVDIQKNRKNSFNSKILKTMLEIVKDPEVLYKFNSPLLLRNEKITAILGPIVEEVIE